MKTTKFKRVGSITVPSGKIDITDPGYDRDVWCRLDGVAVKPGRYRCYASFLKGKDAKECGKRVASISIAHEDAIISGDESLPMFEIGQVGVDAGLMSISEAGTQPDYDSKTWGRLIDEVGEIEDAKGVLATARKFGAKKKQFWSSTGFGDGGYTVWGIDTHDPHATNQIPDVIQIEFIESEDLPEVLRLDKEKDLCYTNPEEDLGEAIGDYLSNTYGYCHTGFDYVDNGDTVRVYNIHWDTSD